MEAEQNMTGQESLAIISQMIKEARKNFSDTWSCWRGNFGCDRSKARKKKRSEHPVRQAYLCALDLLFYHLGDFYLLLCAF